MLQTNELQKDFALRYKFFAYVIFFLLGIYLVNHFKGKLVNVEGEKDFTEDYYKRLFEFKMENNTVHDLKKLGTQRDQSRVS